MRIESIARIKCLRHQKIKMQSAYLHPKYAKRWGVQSANTLIAFLLADALLVFVLFFYSDMYPYSIIGERQTDSRTHAGPLCRKYWDLRVIVLQEASCPGW